MFSESYYKFFFWLLKGTKTHHMLTNNQ
jgi:hypothetical protein